MVQTLKTWQRRPIETKLGIVIILQDVAVARLRELDQSVPFFAKTCSRKRSQTAIGNSSTAGNPATNVTLGGPPTPTSSCRPLRKSVILVTRRATRGERSVRAVVASLAAFRKVAGK